MSLKAKEAAARPEVPDPFEETSYSSSVSSVASVASVASISSVATAPTALMVAVNVACPTCEKDNEADVTLCAFCGGALVAASLQTAASSESGYSVSSGMIVPLSPPGATEAERSSIVGDMPGALIADPLIGVVVAERYRILELLGRGGMGIVYKVEHVRIGKLLAMKLLTGELSHNPDVVRRFKREALTVSKLASPNTVQVFDFGVSDGLTYLVMELVNGEDLGRVLRAGGPMPVARLGKIMIQICNSLAEAHQKGIVHRDIKPGNIMILPARDGTDIAKVLDFGLAKLREGEGMNDVTSQGAIVGTPYFMAPEQIRGADVDHRTDVYALGALMYRALTGHHPFSGQTPMAVLTKHLNDKAVPPHERAPDLGIPLGMSRLVLKALSKSPEGRFQRVEDLQTAIIDEIRATGSQGVENLLDSSELRSLARAAAAASQDPTQPATAVATRDEVEAYERKLRRQRYGAVVGALGVALMALGVGARVVMLSTRAAAFKGVEVEPNNTAAEATKLPLGSKVTGLLGKRIDAIHGDRDFYAIDLPAVAPDAKGILKLQVSALPNIAMCTMIYRPGFTAAVGQYCVGRPGRDLVVPALALEPGPYFIAVLQDLDPYGGTPPFVFENVSDTYTLLAESAPLEAGSEVEPNDQIASATPLGLSLPCTGTIGWAHDEDVFCIPEDTAAKTRWKVHDGLRDSGVLEVTPLRLGEETARVRIHLDARSKPSPTDVVNPWQSEWMPATPGVRQCIRVRITSDPWSAEQAGMVPNGGSEPYVVEVEAIP